MIDVRELWRTRELLWIFASRDVKVRYKQTFFGLAWAVVVPLIQVAVFTVFFGSALGVSDRVDAAAGRELPYALFALTGLIAWNVFKMSLDGASASLLTHANIVRKIYLPRLVLPLAALGKPAVDTVVTWLLMLGMVLWYAGGPASPIGDWRALLASPLLLTASAVAGLAIGLIVAAITVSYRDLQHVMPFLTSILFFVTPVIYSVELLPERWAWLLYLNPVVGFVQAHRAVVMALPLDWTGLVVSTAITTMVLTLGLLYFARAERQFADIG
jgi:lipopolysaccharide transport system permease protein